jgi:hypothetical protein
MNLLQLPTIDVTPTAVNFSPTANIVLASDTNLRSSANVGLTLAKHSLSACLGNYPADLNMLHWGYVMKLPWAADTYSSTTNTYTAEPLSPTLVREVYAELLAHEHDNDEKDYADDESNKVIDHGKRFTGITFNSQTVRAKPQLVVIGLAIEVWLNVDQYLRQLFAQNFHKALRPLASANAMYMEILQTCQPLLCHHQHHHYERDGV